MNMIKHQEKALIIVFSLNPPPPHPQFSLWYKLDHIDTLSVCLSNKHSDTKILSLPLSFSLCNKHRHLLSSANSPLSLY